MSLYLNINYYLYRHSFACFWVELPSLLHQRSVWRCVYADWERVCGVIGAMDWDSIRSDDVDLSWLISSIICACILTATLQKCRNFAWLNKRTVQSMRRRNGAFQQVKWTGSQKESTKYRRFHNRVAHKLWQQKPSILQNSKPLTAYK